MNMTLVPVAAPTTLVCSRCGKGGRGDDPTWLGVDVLPRSTKSEDAARISPPLTFCSAKCGVAYFLEMVHTMAAEMSA